MAVLSSAAMAPDLLVRGCCNATAAAPPRLKGGAIGPGWRQRNRTLIATLLLYLNYMTCVLSSMLPPVALVGCLTGPISAGAGRVPPGRSRRSSERDRAD